MTYPNPMPDGTDETPAPTRNRARDLRLVATGIITGLLIWFALVNLQDVKIKFWLHDAQAPLILVIIIAGVLGAGVAELVGVVVRRNKRASSESEI